MEQGDKEKIRRAYKKACQMNLSADIQNRLKEELENLERSTSPEVVKAPERPIVQGASSQAAVRENLQNEYLQFKDLLLSDGAMAEANQYFVDHSSKICQELNRVEDEAELDQFFQAIKRVSEPDRLLSASSFGRLLVRTKNDEQRFTQLAQFFATRKHNIKNEDTLIISLFFSDPLTWFSRNPVIWNKLSRFIAVHSIDHTRWCNFFGVYEKNQYLMHSPDLEDALWSPLRTDHRYGLWYAIANLHLFLSQDKSEPTYLWDSWYFFQSDNKTKDYWSRLHKWAMSLSAELLTGKNKDVFSHLQIVEPRNALTASDVENYYKRFRYPNSKALQEYLLSFAAEIGNESMELMILQNLVHHVRLSDAQIERLLILARKFKKSSLIEKTDAVRSVRYSVMHPNDKAPFVMRQTGELPTPTEQAIRNCTSDFSLAEKKFVSAYFRLAPWVLYLSQKDSEDFKPLKKREILSDSTARKMRRLAPKFPMALPPKVLVHEAFYSSSLVNEIPNFYPNLPSNPWGKILAGLSQILALNHFDEVMQSVRSWGCPIQSAHTEAAGFRKWLERNGTEAKLNWHQLHASALSVPEQETASLLQRFVIRLATVLSRNDQMALWSLGHAPEDYLIDLEKWLILGNQT